MNRKSTLLAVALMAVSSFIWGLQIISIIWSLEVFICHWLVSNRTLLW